LRRSFVFEVLHEAIRTGKEQRRMAVVVPSDQKRLRVVRSAAFEHLASAVGLTDPMASNNQFVTDVCLHVSPSTVAG
jgi:hypothetical protein